MGFRKDKLDQKLLHRPSPEELVKSGILKRKYIPLLPSPRLTILLYSGRSTCQRLITNGVVSYHLCQTNPECPEQQSGCLVCTTLYPL